MTSLILTFPVRLSNWKLLELFHKFSEIRMPSNPRCVYTWQLDFLTKTAYQPLKTQYVKTSPHPVSPNGITVLCRFIIFEQMKLLLAR